MAATSDQITGPKGAMKITQVLDDDFAPDAVDPVS